jgi:hypothetical protein
MKSFILILLLISSSSCIAQKQGNIWYFGVRAGLNFSSGIAVPIFNGKTGTDVPSGGNQEGTASISDSTGNLLFYTGGKTVWNRDHNPMPNGSGIVGGVSSTQSSIIVPKPGSNNLFFVFTSDEFQSYYLLPFSNGYRYSVVDMCQDNGKGDVVTGQKNVLLLDSSTEKLAVCEDALGNGYWVLGHKMFSDQFNAWHLTSAGISPAVVSHIGTVHGWDKEHSIWNQGSAQGQMKFNPQGTKIALAVGNYDPSIVDLFDFNKNTGQVSNFCHMAIDSLLFKRSYGVEFSPDGSKLYAGVAGGLGGNSVYQYNLTLVDCNSIIASGIKVFQKGNQLLTGMQLGPDNKIYVMSNATNDVGRINYPNLLGTACGYDSSVIILSPASNYYAFPAFIAGYKYHNGLSCHDTNIPADSSCRLDIHTRVYPNPVGNILSVDKQTTACRVMMNLYNALGQLVLKDKIINDGHNEIVLSFLPAGAYFYKFTANETILLSGEIIKE